MLLGETWDISHAEQAILLTTAGGVTRTGKKIAIGSQTVPLGSERMPLVEKMEKFMLSQIQVTTIL